MKVAQWLFGLLMTLGVVMGLFILASQQHAAHRLEILAAERAAHTDEVVETQKQIIKNYEQVIRNHAIIMKSQAEILKRLK